MFIEKLKPKDNPKVVIKKIQKTAKRMWSKDLNFLIIQPFLQLAPENIDQKSTPEPVGHTGIYTKEGLRGAE